MAAVHTSQDLIDQVRQQVDEFNSDSLTDSHILNLLNRAQSNAANIFARRNESIMLSYFDFVCSGGVYEYDLPSDIYNRFITEVQTLYNNIWYNLKRIGIKDVTNYSTNIKTVYPNDFLVRGNTIRLYPVPNTARTIRIWYQKIFDDLVIPQGRISLPYSASNNYFYVDSLGSDLAATGNNSYINIIDFETGVVKSTVKIASIDDVTNKITLATAQGTNRTKYFGHTVTYGSTLSSLIEIDDLICIANGTCVTQLPNGFDNYLTMSAAMDLKRRFGEPSQEEFAAFKASEEDLMKSWAGQEQGLRVSRRSLRFKN